MPRTPAHALASTDLSEALGGAPRYRGKVRDTYDLGDGRLVLVTTDRLSAFDHVLRQAIPLKGQVLNGVAAYFFEGTADVAPNHVLSVPDPNVTLAVRCEPLPVEFVVRGFLAGHAWRTYSQGGRVLCGERLPEGLREAQRLPEPILTPTTKASEGHDEDISALEAVSQGYTDSSTMEEARAYALALFRRGSAIAAERGLLFVDTKYEFGRTPEGRLVVIDEVHTPDSSRYYYAEGYEARLSRNEPQRQLSKEFVREWLMAQGFRGLDGQAIPDLPEAFVSEVSARYVELFETITGHSFTPELNPDPEARIRQALEGVLSAPSATSRP